MSSFIIIDFRIIDTTDFYSSVSYLDLNLNYDTQERIHLKLYYRHDDFQFFYQLSSSMKYMIVLPTAVFR